MRSNGDKVIKKKYTHPKEKTMKSMTSKRFLSLFIVICLVLGFVLPCYAATTSASGTYVKVGDTTSSGIRQLLLYRNYEDGTEATNGFVIQNPDNCTIEVLSDGSNKYSKYTHNSGDHSYYNIDVANYVPDSGSLVFQFNIMFNSVPSSNSTLLQLAPKDRNGSSDTIKIGTISSSKWQTQTTSTNTCGNVTASNATASSRMSANTWYTVTYVFSGSDMSNNTEITCYFNGSKVGTYSALPNSVGSYADVKPGQFRFGSATSGFSFCLDDVILYTADTTDPETALGYTINGKKSTGEFYNEYAAPDVDTSEYDGNAFFKVNVDKALSFAGKKIEGIEPPIEYNGKVYIPTSTLNTLMGDAPYGGLEYVNGAFYVPLDKISYAYSGYHAEYTSMGLIVITSKEKVFVEGAEASLMPVMKKFLFDGIADDGSVTNVFSVDDMTSLDHPYLYANESEFDYLAEVYAAGGSVEPTLYEYLVNRVNNGISIYNRFNLGKTGSYTGLNTTMGIVAGYQTTIEKIPYTSDTTSKGYDIGGRLGQAANHNENILALAFAYQVTGNQDYAKLAYDYAIAMGKWEHWGPGHFLNAADAMAPYAVAYDWLYDGWTDLGFDVAAIELILFTHGLVPAFYSLNETDDTKLPWQSFVQGWNFHTNSNNWNAVCTAGTTVAALALVGSTTSTSGVKIDTTVDGNYNATTAITNYPTGKSSIHNGYSTYQDYAEFIVNQGIYNLPMYGLAQYVPDGSYIESNGYWAYGTNNIYEMTAALASCTTGGDWGILDAWGMDRTAYYAINTMSSDGLSWNYHDSNTITPQETTWFMYLGSDEGLGYTDLAGMRKTFNSTLKQNPSYYDCIYYMSDEEIGDWEFPENQYHMEGIQGYVFRDSWDANDGTLYAAFMGETNNLGHGQIDSGSFIYYNKGTRWFCDIGTEEYNAYGFWASNTRYGYYAMGGEGNNNLIVTSDNDILKYGQSLNGFGAIIATGDNEYGAYAILDNTSAYGSIANSVTRGMLLTNDRKTTVIQDEADFRQAVDLAWVAHIQSGVDVVLSVDGTVAYMYDGKTVIRVKLIDNNNSGLTFRIGNAADEDDRLLDATHDNDYSIRMDEEVQDGKSYVAQKDFSGYERLIIEAKGVTSFNVAVVIEELIPGVSTNDTKGFGYAWVDMANWEPYTDGRNEGGLTNVTKVASVLVTPIIKDDDNQGGGTSIKPDTPIVDIFSIWDASAAAAVMEAVEADFTLGEATTFDAFSFAELQEIINTYGGDNIIEVTLYKSNETPISIDAPCVINGNGNKLAATSSRYICQIDGETTEFKSGSITVTWHLSNGTTQTQTYTNTSSAYYYGYIADGSAITEVYEGNNVYSYYTTGNAWATTEGGKQAAAADMIVTSENCHFYQTLKKYDGALVTVRNGVITGYKSFNTIDEFYNIFNSTYDRICLTNDFSLTSYSTSGGGINTMNFHFNGYTITYYSSVTSDHLFTNYNTTTEVNFYGPGGIDNQATGSNALLKQSVGPVNFYNVDFVSSHVLIDYRAGKGALYNCNIEITMSGKAAISVINRNNIHTTDAAYPDLLVSGCVINMPMASGSNQVFTLRSNSRLEVTGGTSIKVAGGCYLFGLINDAVNGESYNFDFSKMEARIGDIYHNCANIVLPQTGNTFNTDAEKEVEHNNLRAKVYYTAGASFATDPTGSINIYSGNHVVKQNSTALPYVLAGDFDTAYVEWSYGGKTVSEKWLAGSTPVADDKVKAQFSIASNKMITFDTTPVSGDAYTTFTGIVLDAFALKVNMSLQEDFNLNFFIENIGAMTFKVDGVTVTPDTTSMPGYYKVSKTGINPTTAAKGVTLEVTYGSYTLTKLISPVDYAAKVLESEGTSLEAKRMMINVLKYIDTAYVYWNKNVGQTAGEYNSVVSLYKQYKKYATASVVDRQAVDMSAVSDALENAQLNLETAPKFRFNLNSAYTGTVTVSYTASSGETVAKAFDVVNGICNGNSYIEIGFKAYYLTDTITITTANGSAEYSLANYYYYSAVEAGSPLANLLNALYAYCETARLYKDSI